MSRPTVVLLACVTATVPWLHVCVCECDLLVGTTRATRLVLACDHPNHQSRQATASQI